MENSWFVVLVMLALLIGCIGEDVQHKDTKQNISKQSSANQSTPQSSRNLIGRSILIITNEKEEQSAERIKAVVESINYLTIDGAEIETDIQKIENMSLVAYTYPSVILCGDDTALTSKIRDKLAEYLKNGGDLILIRGAGLKHLEPDGKTIDSHSFGWNVGEMKDVLKFAPDCQGDCDTGKVMVPRKEFFYRETKKEGDKYEFKYFLGFGLKPIKREHPILKRLWIKGSWGGYGPWGLNQSVVVNTSKYPEFKGAMRVTESERNSFIDFEWFDEERNEHTAPALIIYEVDGNYTGKLIYFAYNPLEVGQDKLFKNAVKYAFGRL